MQLNYMKLVASITIESDRLHAYLSLIFLLDVHIKYLEYGIFV